MESVSMIIGKCICRIFSRSLLIVNAASNAAVKANVSPVNTDRTTRLDFEDAKWRKFDEPDSSATSTM